MHRYVDARIAFVSHDMLLTAIRAMGTLEALGPLPTLYCSHPCCSRHAARCRRETTCRRRTRGRPRSIVPCRAHRARLHARAVFERFSAHGGRVLLARCPHRTGAQSA